MIGLIVMACASQEYVLPQAEVFEEDWKEVFFTSSGESRRLFDALLMVGQAQDCDDCSGTVVFVDLRVLCIL